MWANVKRYALRPALSFIKVFCTYQVFSEYVGGIRHVSGPSMLPTFAATTEWIISDSLSQTLSLPINRGDLVVLASPRAPSEDICKRVIGLPGDTVCVDPTGEYAPSTEHCVVPRGHIWISGDNAAASRDSREYGPVPIALVKARVLLRFYPFSKFTIFRNPTTVFGEI